MIDNVYLDKKMYRYGYIMVKKMFVESVKIKMMKTKVLTLAMILSGFLFFNSVNGQSRYTHYDELPGIIKSDKPVYNNSFPDWAKMLYQYPINYNEINEAFEKYEREHKGEENAIIRYYKNWRREITGYVDNDGNIDLPDINELRKTIRERQLKAGQKLKSIQDNNSAWTFWGPKETFWLNRNGDSDVPSSCPWQVNVYCIDVAQTNDNIIYVGTETHLVNKSVDKGNTWELLGQNYPFGGGISAVAIHPDNPDVVFISAGGQIHKTEDGGKTWIPLLANDKSFGANHIIINPSNPSIMIATSSDGVFVSNDGGMLWTKKYSLKAWDVEFKPGNTDSVFVLCSNSGDSYEMALSKDGGDSFSKLSSFPSSLYEASGGLIAVTPANKDIIYVTMLAREGEQGIPYIYKGELNGTNYSWTKTKEGVLGGGLGDFSNGQGYFDLVLEASPLDEDVVFWGTCSLWKSTNGGVDYIRVGGYGGDYAIHPDIQGMKMLLNGDTWVTTDGGVNYTTDEFTSKDNYHVKVQGLIGSDMWGFDQGWNEDIVVGGRYHNGNTAIADFYGDKALRMGGAESPTGWVLQGHSRHVAFSDLGKGWILPKTAEGAPEGRFIFSKYPNMDEYGGRRSNLLHHPNYYDILYVGEENGFWRSTDGGTSWDLLNSFPDRVRYMQISFSNPDVIYADVVNFGLYKSEDGGINWVRKRSLTSTYESSHWNGKLFFAISPYNENVVYACLSNGTWSKDIGKIYRSADGGDTWKDWTSGLSEYTKNIVIQPTTDKVDLVYLFSTGKNGKPASVYYRRADQSSSWTKFDNDFPVGMKINLALPFYRDSKIRCAGAAGVWETPMQEESFIPIISPWCQKDFFNCTKDTVYFDDHSMLNHAGASWHWEFSPEPKYISDANVRNPVVFFGDTLSYDVSLTVTVNGVDYNKTISDMVTISKCPSIEDCNKPADIPKDDWKLLYVDSEEYNFNRYGRNAIDGDPATLWHTEWSTIDPDTPYPHEIQADMGESYLVSKFTYFPRQDGGVNGTIKDYELYVSEDKSNWGETVLEGSFEGGTSPKIINIDPPVAGRYFKFVGINEVNGGPWASAGELSFVGCYKPNTSIFNNKYSDEIKAFPVPTDGKINLSLFTNNTGEDMSYALYSVCGQFVESGVVKGYSGNYSVDLSAYAPGVYFIILENKQGIKYRVKVVRK